MKTFLTNATDQELVKLYSNGNDNAFECIIQRYQKYLYGFLLKMTNDSTITEDVLQNTFFRLVNYFKSNKREEIQYFKTWLCTVAKNELSSYYKKYQKNFFLVSLSDLGSEQVFSPEAALEYKYQQQRLKELLNYLTPLEKQVICLKCEGYSYDEICEFCEKQTTRENLKTVFYNAKRKLININQKLNVA